MRGREEVDSDEIVGKERRSRVVRMERPGGCIRVRVERDWGDREVERRTRKER
jgi:hypothetical protein